VTDPVVRLPLASLTRYPGNPRRGNVPAIQASLRHNGQYAPLIVRKADLVILAGNHTAEALEAEGALEADCVLVEADDAQSRRIVAYDNRLRELGAVDPAGLLGLLETLMNAGDLAGSGYTADEIDDMAARFAEPLAVATFTGGYAEDPRDTASRTEAGRESRVAADPVKPLVLVYTTDTYASYAEPLERLRAAWGLSSAQVIARVLRAAAAVEYG